MSHGQALSLRLKLERLRIVHGVAVDLVSIPALPAVDGDLIVEGLASTCDLDLARTKFAPFAFDNVGTKVPLLYRHDKDQVAGAVQRLWYDPKGNLKVKALLTHPEAKRCSAFSVAGTVHRYELKEAEDPARFHALITSASIDEISVTNAPANPRALITSRAVQQPSALGQLYALAAAKAAVLAKIVAVIQGARA
jgi:phage head maturation protease